MGLSGCGSGWGRRVVAMGGIEWWGWWVLEDVWRGWDRMVVWG